MWQSFALWEQPSDMFMVPTSSHEGVESIPDLAKISIEQLVVV